VNKNIFLWLIAKEASDLHKCFGIPQRPYSYGTNSSAILLNSLYNNKDEYVHRHIHL